jgi:serine/threonine-protein kinase
VSGIASSQLLPRLHTLAGYDVVAKLRVGGMAALYLGRKTGAGGFAKYVAIKVVLEHLAEDPMLVSMFLDEARVSARIEHPNVVHIHELGAEGGAHFLVMEYVAGASLSQLLRAAVKQGRRFAPAFVAHLGMQVAAGLHAAHEVTDDHGAPLHVVHRDVSPKNVLLAYKGYVKLIDFGIAKVRDASQATSAGSLKGTLRYMSPEQAEGRANIDRRSDVFSLGIVLWELLTGRPLFRAETDIAALDLVRRAVVPPPSQFAPVPPALEQVVLRMLAASPADRYASTAEVQRALAAAMPEVSSITAEHIGELVGVLCPPVADASLDPGVAQALGRPTVPHDVDALLAWLTGPIEGTPGRVSDGTSGVSGTHSKGGTGAPSLVTDPSRSRPGVEVGPLSAVSAVVTNALPAPAPPRFSVGMIVAGCVGLLAIGLLSGWWALRQIENGAMVPAPVAAPAPTAAAPSPPPPAAPAVVVAPATSEAGVRPVAEQPLGSLGEVRPGDAPSDAPSVARQAERRSPPRTGRSTVAAPPEDAPAPQPRRRRDTHLTNNPVISTEF